MKPALIYLLLSASLGALAQSNIHTFTSPDGVYQFTYPAYFLRCSPGPPYVDWRPDDCLGGIPVCPQPEQTAKAVCVAYPKARYKEYPEFEAAAFSVAELNGSKTEKECLQVSDALRVPLSGKKTVVINGVSFAVFEEGGSAAGSSMDGRAYHAFHAGKCYELGTRTAFVSTGLDEPIKHLSKADWKGLDKSLWQVAASFRFLK